MTEKELVGMGGEGDLGGLGGCGVVGLLGKEGVFGGEGGFVVETGDVLQQVCQGGTIGGVGAVGVGADGVGWCGETVVGDEGAVFGGPIHACLDVVDLGCGDVVVIDHVTADMARGGLLTEEVAAAGDTVREGQSGDGDGAVFVDDLGCRGVDFVEDDSEGGVGTEVVNLWLEESLEVVGTIDVEVLDASEKPEGGEHSDESEDVVAMQVGEEDGLNLGKCDAGFPQCHLGAFGTVEHEELFTDVDYL